MIKQLLTKLSLLVLLTIGFSPRTRAQCTPRPLPFTENFATTPFAACTPSVGGWTSTSAASGAGWWLPNTNYAGGTSPEVEAYGDQANGGVSETIRLKSPPLNTTGAASINLSFKHNLYLTNSAASGSGTITINVEYSPDSVNWNWAYSEYYNATPSLQSVVMETRNIIISGLTNTTYIRFNISGVLFKVWGWEIDNINVTVNSSTAIPSLALTDKMIYQNNDDKKLEINIGEGRNCSLMLYDILGNVLYKSEVNGQMVIDISTHHKGIYMLRMENEFGSLTKKFVLE
jgi:hypothetical protein